MEIEVEPQLYVEKLKHLNKLDEGFGFMCIHTSRELLFNLDVLKNPKEVWDNLEYLFGKYYEMRGHILENDLIALRPSNFKNKQHFSQHFLEEG